MFKQRCQPLKSEQLYTFQNSNVFGIQAPFVYFKVSLTSSNEISVFIYFQDFDLSLDLPTFPSRRTKPSFVAPALPLEKSLKEQIRYNLGNGHTATSAYTSTLYRYSSKICRFVNYLCRNL